MVFSFIGFFVFTFNIAIVDSRSTKKTPPQQTNRPLTALENLVVKEQIVQNLDFHISHQNNLGSLRERFRFTTTLPKY